MTELSPALAKLRSEYRPTMGAEVVHDWARDVIRGLNAMARSRQSSAPGDGDWPELDVKFIPSAGNEYLCVKVGDKWVTATPRSTLALIKRLYAALPAPPAKEAGQ